MPTVLRAPAEPVGPVQSKRRQRVLSVAAELGERDGFDRVQMMDIAKGAGVAIGTLYRYFPSKSQLYSIVLYEELHRFAASWVSPPGPDAVGEVGEHLVLLTRRLATRPRLAAAMIQCATAGYVTASLSEVAMQQLPLRQSILRAINAHDPTEEECNRVKLLQYAWWGVFVSIIDGKTTPAEGEGEIRLAARLLLANCA
ncbi:TetR/AcrR family transcriptional regulator [Pseudonocardia xishanensis]|uniref:TetR family transcriptional regulator n=1 Tax=Pseudonocardia xishanensis TaxID=630995 RepID=A0ABP8RRF3_9PSEU